jgi:Glycosyltransferase like family 2
VHRPPGTPCAALAGAKSRLVRSFSRLFSRCWQATINAAREAALPEGCSRTIYMCDDGKDPAKREWVASLGNDVIYVSGAASLPSDGLMERSPLCARMASCGRSRRRWHQPTRGCSCRQPVARRPALPVTSRSTFFWWRGALAWGSRKATWHVARPAAARSAGPRWVRRATCLRLSGTGRVRKKGEMNGKSGNMNNVLSQIYPNNCYIPPTELICVFDADQVANPEFFLRTVVLFDAGDDVGMVGPQQSCVYLSVWTSDRRRHGAPPGVWSLVCLSGRQTDVGMVRPRALLGREASLRVEQVSSAVLRLDSDDREPPGRRATCEALRVVIRTVPFGLCTSWGGGTKRVGLCASPCVRTLAGSDAPVQRGAQHAL